MCFGRRGCEVIERQPRKSRRRRRALSCRSARACRFSRSCSSTRAGPASASAASSGMALPSLVIRKRFAFRRNATCSAPPPAPPPPNTHTPAYQSIGCFVHALQPPPIYTPHFIRPLESDMLCTPPFHTRPASPIICLHQRPRRVHRRRGGMKNTLQALRRCPDENSS